MDLVSLLPADFTLLAFALSFALILVAAFVRAFSGFGFALLAVPGLVMLMEPIQAVPICLLLQLGAGLGMVPSTWKQMDFSSLRLLLPGGLLLTPVGALLLAVIDPTALKLLICAIVMIIALLLWRGFALKKRPGPVGSFAAGASAGLLGGLAAIPGPPVVLFYLSAPGDHRTSRASLNGFFLAINLLAVLTLLLKDAFDMHVLVWSLLLAPAMLIGTLLGHHGFNRADAGLFRRIAVGLLFVTGAIGFATAL
ncbi:sulfite exporter TauE/SafE family protein [Falsiroseomonas sp.]|uniref:sulfite exporter TauE/SafE family protein n=1 Tax=Falsiroseomonas sp. TaxID=2870721 RepID=UPI00271FDB3F|nr:sulfite exporter TauE/SafE family protein [Falsiroseomonas sp.]MDO9503303.1 sulfite exporter TauE/SafE family protein [Falsiroseomonas sp.]